MYKWLFSGIDNYGAFFAYNVWAKDKASAIEKGFTRLCYNNAYRTSAHWNCTLCK